MGQGYRAQREGVDALVQQIRNIKRALDDLNKRITALGIQIDPQTNSLILGNGRSVQIYDGDGNLVSELGQLTTGPTDVGLRLLRTDPGVEGTLALQFRGGSFALVDADGNIVVADDITSGRGLAKPYVGGGIQWADTNVSTWPQTTSAAWIAVTTGNYVVANPKVQFDFWLQVDAATTGQFRLLVNGAQVGSTKTVTGAFDTLSGANMDLPAGVNIGDKVVVTLEAQRTTGTGGVRAIPLWFCGDQS